MCRELLRLGIVPAALNFRGCGGEPNRAPRSYHSGETGDPALILSLLRERYPSRAIGALGFSLGGNVLLKLMGERAQGGTDLLDAAVAMSVPYDLAAGCGLLERTQMGRVYTTYFLRSLCTKVRLKEALLAGRVDLEAALSARTIWEFDERVTAPLNGFRDAAEYYGECSSSRFLPQVGVPTLLLHARDDPFLPSDSIPADQVARNPHVQLALQSRGGHVGFLEGTPWRPSFWADEESVRFLASHLLPPTDTACPRGRQGAEKVP